ncbi:NAD kinase 2, mitochondrial-like [Saccoglossus kowalevskii]|uniref:NAD(+) kinase n=1 Tax=Saccoglossus kowalevskii TaxID=10224 RepID=A0ABM0MIW4_SACKO|nr:PREDICTED: NAD kinase 2, mitochondrial-like [Saccoglossus kowalevskii]
MHRAYIAKIVARLRLLQPAKTSTAPVTCTYCSQQNGESPDFDPNRVLVLSKTTRYEFEKRRFPDLNDDQLQRLLSKRGSDYGKIYRIHNVHKRNIEKITDTLEKRKLEYKVVSRNDFTIEEVKKSDAVIAAGGDGTFLLAASKVFDDTPVIGVNTDAKRSEGFLALPNKCTVNFEDTLSKLLTGKFKWTWRQRIRVTVEGGHVNTEPVDLHEEIIGYPEHYDRHHNPKDDSIQDLSPRVLPVFALNEVFVGESLASRVSYYEVGINDGPIEKQKSSGLTVSTGSGSTSW